MSGKKIITSIIAGLSVLGLGLVVNPPAASAGKPDCNGRLCAYGEINWVGLLSPASATRGVIFNFSGLANDKTSSWSNETAVDGEYYSGANRGGSRFCANYRTANGWVGSGANDIFSSFYLFSNTTTCS